MRKYDIWSGLFLLALGAVLCKGSLELGLGTWTVPGPGFLPFGAGLLLVAFSTGILVLAAARKEKSNDLMPQKIWRSPENRRAVLLLLASLILYNLLWTQLGFSLTTFLFMGFLFRFVGKRRWWVTITGAVLTSLTAYLLFQVLLRSQLPTGVIGY